MEFVTWDDNRNPILIGKMPNSWQPFTTNQSIINHIYIYIPYINHIINHIIHGNQTTKQDMLWDTSGYLWRSMEAYVEGAGLALGYHHPHAVHIPRIQPPSPGISWVPNFEINPDLIWLVGQGHPSEK